jgi:L-iditol 2-dehydrogenase
MHALFLPGGRQVVIRDIDRPSVSSGEVLIEMRAAGLCGSDLHMHYRPSPQERRGVIFDLHTDPDVIPGHEASGVIAEVGPGVDYLKKGDRVAVHHMAGCGHCMECRRGFDINCPQKWGTYGLDKPGAMADFMVARARDCVIVPEQVSYAEACYYSCGAGTGYLALRRAGLGVGDSVAVVGLGPVGLAAGYFAHLAGAVVVGFDPVEQRRQYALAHGFAQTAPPPETGHVDAGGPLSGIGADVVIETSGFAAGRSLALDLARIGGRVVCVGFAEADNNLDVQRQVIQKQLDVRGAWMFPLPDLQEMLDSVARRNVSIEPLITARLGIEDGEKAWASFDAGSLGKTVLCWPDS